MALSSLLTQQADVQRHVDGTVDEYGNQSAGSWQTLTTVGARWEEMFAYEMREGRTVNVMRWRVFIAPTDLTVDDRLRNPETGEVFGIFAIDREWGKASLHHLTVWTEQVVE